jgi:outer membrane protein TolC
MDLNLAGAKLERMASEIREAALSTYRQVISARAVLAIREAAGETLAEQRDLLRKEVEMGLAIPADLAGADITLEESRIELRSMHIDLKETERQFAELLGLEELPPLSEEVDTERSSVLPSAGIARSMTEARNPDLAEERSLIMKRQGELKYAALSWIPTIRLTGGFGVNGRRYPLTRHTWTVGINIDFSSPYIANTISGSAGWEPPYDRTARFQNSMSPLPDPAAGFTKNQAELALALERKKYDLNIERLGRAAETAVEKCRMADQKRALALEAGSLARERYRLAELKRELGLLTRLELMEEKIECSQKEIAAVEAAVILLEAERELERLMDLRPGELKLLAGRGGGS